MAESFSYHCGKSLVKIAIYKAELLKDYTDGMTGISFSASSIMTISDKQLEYLKSLGVAKEAEENAKNP